MKYAKSVKHEKQLAKKVRMALRSGDNHRLHAETRRYLNSYDCKVIAAREAIKTCKRKTHKSVEQMAQEMCVWQPCDERVFVDVAFREDPHADPRFILGFGPEQQARQILLRNCLKARWKTAASQTMFNKGRPAAITMAKSYYAAGFRYVMEVDVHHCFKSFDIDGVAETLSLPERVVENVLTGPSLNISPSKYCKRDIIYHAQTRGLRPMELFEALFQSDWEQARQGLIEGSKVSPFVAELLLADVCKACSDCENGQVINYADNFLLMAETEDDLLALNEFLQKGLRALPAGPLKVNKDQIKYEPGQEFEFLGYALKPRGDNLEVEMSRKNRAKARQIRKRAHKLLSSNMPLVTKERIFKEERNRHRSLVQSFSQWLAAKEFHAEKMIALEKHVEKDRIPPVRRRRRRSA